MSKYYYQLFLPSSSSTSTPTSVWRCLALISFCPPPTHPTHPDKYQTPTITSVSASVTALTKLNLSLAQLSLNLLQNISHLFQGSHNWFSKQEMKLSKKEMELFLLLPDLWSKNFFYKIFYIQPTESKPNFRNRK